MRIKSIELQNFRNIASLSLQAAPDVNVIHGENAQGKTNLTEAIWMFTGAKSFRGAKDREMIRFGEDHCRTDLVFQSALREETASIELNQPDARGEKRAKTVCLNEVPLNSAAELAGQFYAVVFSPAHLSLVREGPALRRKFLDTAIGQIMPRYGHYLHEYQRTLLQRNTLLKDAERHPQLLETMEIWEENLARAAAAVAFCRARYVERIRPLAAQVYEGISSGREQFDLHYLCGVNEPHSCTRDQLRSYYQQQLYREREEDMIRGATQCGPHRDDLELLLMGRSARIYGSRGQQRSIVLALKLAEADILYRKTGERPVILLDDVMSDLDMSRRDYLLNHLDGRQVFITCCDPETVRLMETGRGFYVEKGTVRQDTDEKAGEVHAENETPTCESE